MIRSRAFVAVLLVLSLLSAGGAAEPTYTLDADHELASEQAITTFDQQGQVSTNITTPRLSVTVAEQSAACGVTKSSLSDARNDYLCIHYKSELPQTTRLYIPDDYWHPYIRDDKEPITEAPNAQFRPVKGGNYTSVTVSFEGASKAVYAIPEDVTASYYLIEHANDQAKEVGGITLWSSGTEWRHINASRFENEGYVRIHADPETTIIEYDADPDPMQTTWLSVPESEGSHEPLYRTQRSGQEKVIYVFSEDANGTRVRYRAAGKGLGSIDTGLREIRQIDEKAKRWVDDVVPDFLRGDG